MTLKSAILGSLFAAAAIFAGATAHAATVTTFDFQGSASAGQNGILLPGFPAGGVARVADPSFNYAATVGAGAANPFIFAVGAASAGKASADASVTVTIDITNDTGVASDGSFSALIFAGAVGVANPDFTSASCAKTAIESCGKFLSGTTSINPGEAASLDFSALLDGALLYGGSIAVNSAGKSATFSNGFSLTGFGPDAANANLFSWADTLISGVSLGVFAPGETKTLTFLVSASVATAAGFGCKLVAYNCPLALSGFGDPPPGNGGVIIGPGRTSASFFSFVFQPVTPIPLPPALFLFTTAIAAFGFAKGAGNRRG